MLHRLMAVRKCFGRLGVCLAKLRSRTHSFLGIFASLGESHAELKWFLEQGIVRR